MAQSYKEYLQKDVQREEKRQLTPTEKRKNRWDYHKWIVLIAVVVVGILANIIYTALTNVRPDYQVGYIGTQQLPEDTINALAQQLADLGEGLNGDGQTLVTIHQYAKNEDTPDAAMGQYSAEVTLMADLETCDSYFFLLEDPDKVQKDYGFLAGADGNAPSEFALGSELSYLWTDCPTLAEMDLGRFTEEFAGVTAEGDSNSLVQGLYLARRCFYGNKACRNQEGCEALWAKLTEGAE